MECSCRLCPSPGMYAVTSMPEDRRTRQTLRRAEFGFFGVVVYTRVQTPRRWGEPLSAGVLALSVLDWRALRTSCWMVGTVDPRRSCCPTHGAGRSAGWRPRHTRDFSWGPGDSPTPSALPGSRWRCTRDASHEL